MWENLFLLLKGNYCIRKSIEVFFERPAYIGDILTVSGRAKSKDGRFKQEIIKARITNQQGRIILKSNILAGFYG